MLAPNDQTTYCTLIPTPFPKVNQELLDFLNRKQMTVFVYGSATYDDIFGKPHWLTFCRSMQPDGSAWDNCKTHNDTGDGEKPN
jgi:hypothetical protein